MAITTTIYGGNIQLTGNPIWIKLSGGSAPVGSSEYKLMLKVISEDGKLAGAPFTDAISPDSSGEAWFNISGLVDQPVKAVFQYPAVGAVVAYPTQAFNIQVQCGERYIDSAGELQETWGATSSVFQMLKGGLSPRQIAMMETAGTNFYKTYIEGKKFLTARPQGDFVHPTQWVKLWFMFETDATATFRVKGVYDDGTDASYAEEVSFDVDNLYEFNCNPSRLGIALEPTGKQMVYFDVWIDFGAGVSSHVRRFNFDWRPVERPVFMFFANSLGGVDDVYFSGFIQDKFTTEGTVVGMPPQRGDTVYDPTLHFSGKTGQNRWIFNTGWKEIPDLQYYRDLMLARQAWYLYSNISVTTYIVIPVLVDVSEKLLFNRKEDQFSMEMEVSEAHQSAFAFDNRMY